MQSHDKEDGGHEVVSPAPHVAHHPARGCGDRADGGDGRAKCPPRTASRCHTPAPRSSSPARREPDNERDAGQVARAEDDAQDAHTTAALSAMSGAPSTAWLRLVKSWSTTCHISRITHHASRITHRASRFTFSPDPHPVPSICPGCPPFHRNRRGGTAPCRRRRRRICVGISSMP